MAGIPNPATPGIPLRRDPNIFQAKPSGNISVGDFLIFNGDSVVSTALANATTSNVSGAFASAAGIAMDANPVSDWYGVSRSQDSIPVARAGIFQVSAHFTGTPDLGVGAYPVTTGSGVYSVTGHTGVGAEWQTAEVQNTTGTTLSRIMATVIGTSGATNATSGQLTILFGLPPTRYW